MTRCAVWTALKKPGWIGWQTIILAATLFFAICIGVKQNEINENLLNLNYFPEVGVTYEQQSDQVRVHNGGKTGIWVYGIGNIPPDPMKLPQLLPTYVSPGGSCLVANAEGQGYSKQIVAVIGNYGKAPITFNVFIEGKDHKKYTVKGIFYCEVTNGSLKITDVQIVSVEPDWRAWQVIWPVQPNATPTPTGKRE